MSLPPQKIVDNDLFVVNRIDQRGQVETYKTKARDIGVFLLEGAKPPGSHPEDKYINDGELNVYGELLGFGAGHINLHSANEYCEGKLTFDGGFFVSGTDMDVKIEHDYLEIATNLACLNGGIDGSTRCLRLDMYWLADNIICHGNGLETKGNCIGIDLCTHSGLIIDSKGCLEVNLCPNRGVVHSDLDGCLEIDLNYLVTSLSCDGLRPGNGDPDSLCIEIDMAWLSANIRCGDPTNPLAAPESGLIDGGGCIKVDPCWVSDQWNLDNDNPSEAPQDTNSIDVQGCRIAINHEWLLKWAQDNIHDIEVDGLCITRSPNGNLFEEKVYIYQDVSCIRNYTCDNNQTITFKQNDYVVQTYTPCQQLDNELIAFTYTVHQNGDHRAEFKPWISDEHLDVYRHQWKQEGDLIKGTFEPLTTDSLLVVYEHEIRQTGKFWSTFKPLDEHRVTDIRKIEWYQSGDLNGTWEPLYGDERIDVYHHTIKQGGTTKTTFKPLLANSETVVNQLTWKQNGAAKGTFKPLDSDANIDVYKLTINVKDADGNSSTTVFEPLNANKTVTIEAGGGGGGGGDGDLCAKPPLLINSSGCVELKPTADSCAPLGKITTDKITNETPGNPKVPGIVLGINGDSSGDGDFIGFCGSPTDKRIRLVGLTGWEGSECGTSSGDDSSDMAYFVRNKGKKDLESAPNFSAEKRVFKNSCVAYSTQSGKSLVHRNWGNGDRIQGEVDASDSPGSRDGSRPVGDNRLFDTDLVPETSDDATEGFNMDTVLDALVGVGTASVLGDGIVSWERIPDAFLEMQDLEDNVNCQPFFPVLRADRLAAIHPSLAKYVWSDDSYYRAPYDDEDPNDPETWGKYLLNPDPADRTRVPETANNHSLIVLLLATVRRYKTRLDNLTSSSTRSGTLTTLGINEYNNETAAANSGLGQGEVYWDLELDRMRAVT